MTSINNVQFGKLRVHENTIKTVLGNNDNAERQINGFRNAQNEFNDVFDWVEQAGLDAEVLMLENQGGNKALAWLLLDASRRLKAFQFLAPDTNPHDVVQGIVAQAVKRIGIRAPFLKDPTTSLGKVKFDPENPKQILTKLGFWTD